MNTVKEPLTPPVPPPCSDEHPQDREPSKDSTNNFNRSRCQFTYSDGRRCSNERAALCVHHGAKPRRGFGDEVAPDGPLGGAELEALCSDLTTATNINRALARVFLLTAQGRISQKQAVAFGYLSQLLLQTVPGIRSEFVSAFGYHPWQENLTTKLKSSGSAAKVYPPAGESHGHQELSPVQEVELSPLKKVGLKSSLESNHNDDPDDPDGGRGNPEQHINGVVEPKKAVGITAFFRHEEVPAPVNKARLSAQSLREGLTPDDWESLYHRGRDLLAGKYSVTPEGRREAKALDTDLELIKPPAVKMPKGARASVIEHMKRWIAQKKVTMRPASSSRANKVSEGPLRSPAFPALNYYGHPIPMAVPYDEIERGAQFASRTPSCGESHGHQELSPLNKVSPPPKFETPNIKSPIVPVSPPSSRPSAPAVSSDPPPTRRPKKPRRGAQTLSPEPPLRSSPAPLAPTSEPDLPSDPPNSTAHAADWYTPPAWSKNRKPDPFPSRKEKRKRELRGMSNSKLRHLQHLNSRAF